MVRAVLRIVVIFLTFAVVFELQRILFYGCHMSVMPEDITNLFVAMRHGFAMDCSMAAYLTIVPSLLTVISTVWPAAWILRAERVYYAVVALIIAVITVMDIGLYSYWNFRLDATPFFYIATSPRAAFASVEWWMYPLGVVAVALLSVAIFCLFNLLCRKLPHIQQTNWKACVSSLLVTAMLFLPIRGGFGVATMNPGHSYFSQNMRLNHVAVNPEFNLVYSFAHQIDFKSQYRFMSDEEADAVLTSFEKECTDPNKSNSDSVPLLLMDHPDVYVVILESFSAHLLPSLGGDSVAMRLDSIAAEGLLFRNFYASSFRTDRALPAILSGMPAQPSTSIMKYAERVSALPSLASSLDRRGYDTWYFYGGDLNFTNMKAYLVGTGFKNIIGENDFGGASHKGKWGVPDHEVFQRAIETVPSCSSDRVMAVIQTSSSHEPFDVPYSSSRFAENPRLNAFAYTDSCLGNWYEEMKKSERWPRTLVVIVPDHQGCWPENIEDPVARHHVPLVIAGGALNRKGVCDNYGSQPDIVPTILASMGMDISDFPFGHNLLDIKAPHYAFFTEPSLAGVKSDNAQAVIATESGSPIGTHSQIAVESAKALLQKLYDYIDSL